MPSDLDKDSLPSARLNRTVGQVPPTAFHHRKSRSKNHDKFTPIRPTKDKNRTTSSETKAGPAQQYQTKRQNHSNLRQTKLFTHWNDVSSVGGSSKHVTSAPSTSRRKTTDSIAQYNPINQMKPTVINDEASRKPGHSPAGPSIPPVVARSLEKGKAKSRHSEPLTRPRLSPKPDTLSKTTPYHERMTRQGTSESIIPSAFPSNKKRWASRPESIEIQETSLPVNKSARALISSDTIELHHTSTPPPNSPHLSPRPSPLPEPQSVYSLGLDISTMCSPLTYQVLHPKEKIRSFNRVHGGWLEDEPESSRGEVVEPNGYIGSSPVPPRVSRHRVVSNDVPSVTHHGAGPERQQVDGATVSIADAHQPGVHSEVRNPHISQPMNDIGETTALDPNHVGPFILCAESPEIPKMIDLDIQRDMIEGQEPLSPAHRPPSDTHQMLNSQENHVKRSRPIVDASPSNRRSFESFLAPTQPDKVHRGLLFPESLARGRSDWDQSLLAPTQPTKRDQILLFPESMARGRTDWDESLLAPTQPGKSDTVLLFPESMTRGRLDWYQKDHSPSRSPPAAAGEVGHREPIDDVEGNVTLQENSPVLAKEHDLCDTIGSNSPTKTHQNSRVLVEESQEDDHTGPSPKRARILAEDSQPSPQRKPHNRSLAPPTPISVRTQYQREIRNRGDIPTRYRSPHQPPTTSPLKKIAQVGNWKDRNREAWTHDREAQIVNPPVARQANITDFFDQPEPPRPSITPQITDRERASESKARNLLFQQSAIFGRTDPSPSRHLHKDLSDDEIEDVEPDEPSTRFDELCPDSEDGSNPEGVTKEEIEIYLARKRWRCERFGFDPRSSLYGFPLSEEHPRPGTSRMDGVREPDGHDTRPSHTESVREGGGDDDNMLLMSDDIDIPTQELIEAAHALHGIPSSPNASLGIGTGTLEFGLTSQSYRL